MAAAPRTPSPAADPRPTLVIYSRRECHLCDVAMAAIEQLRQRIDFTVELRDVDADATWRDAYGEQVPVGFIGDRKVFKYRVDPHRLATSLLSGR